MRFKLALLALVLVVGIVFVCLRTQSSDANPSIVVPSIRETSTISESPALSADKQTVQLEQLTRTVAPAATPKPPEILDEPVPTSFGDQPADVLDASGAPVVLTSTPVEAEDVGFLKKYGDAGENERLQALEDLRRFAESVARGEQGKVTPEAMAEVKREMSWLKAHSGS
jgi:hypothetical protein